LGRGYSGYYKPKHKSKYIGDKRNIYYRSLWERSFCKWCDLNNKVMKWAIEPFVIPYYDKGQKKYRKYNPDFYIKMENGKRYLIEIKPDHETKPPKVKRRTKRTLLAESTYITNQSKWDTATIYCKKNNMEFRVVTEFTMKEMGIKIITTPPRKRRKKGVSKKKVKYTNRKTSSGLK